MKKIPIILVKTRVMTSSDNLTPSHHVWFVEGISGGVKPYPPLLVFPWRRGLPLFLPPPQETV